MIKGPRLVDLNQQTAPTTLFSGPLTEVPIIRLRQLTRLQPGCERPADATADHEGADYKVAPISYSSSCLVSTVRGHNEVADCVRKSRLEDTARLCLRRGNARANQQARFSVCRWVPGQESHLVAQQTQTVRKGWQARADEQSTDWSIELSTTFNLSRKPQDCR